MYIMFLGSYITSKFIFKWILYKRRCTYLYCEQAVKRLNLRDLKKLYNLGTKGSLRNRGVTLIVHLCVCFSEEIGKQ